MSKRKKRLKRFLDQVGRLESALPTVDQEEQVMALMCLIQQCSDWVAYEVHDAIRDEFYVHTPGDGSLVPGWALDCASSLGRELDAWGTSA